MASSHTGPEWVRSESAWLIAGLCASCGLGIALYNIIKHITYYTLPEQQLHIIRIIFIVPLYCIVSWLSMGFTDYALYFETVRDIYEAFVIYCFLTLILGYVGGEANCVALISLKEPLKQPWPFCCCPRIGLDVRFLRFCKQSCIQFIIIKPVMAILNITMLATNHYDSPYYRFFAGAVYNIAYTLALYGLLLFYLACKSDIRAFSPVRKFFAVKIVIFATYWQALLVSFAPGLEPGTAELWNDFILCLEMSIFAIIHVYSFPWWEFRTGMPSSKELVAQNAKAVLSFKDVVRDVYHNVAPAYQTYVLQTADGNVKQYKTKTYMVGNLNDPKVHNKFMPNFKALRKKYANGFKKKGNSKYLVHTDDDIEDSRLESLDAIETEFTEIDYDEHAAHCVDMQNGACVEAVDAHDNNSDIGNIFDDFGDLGDIDLDNRNYNQSISNANVTPDSQTKLIDKNVNNMAPMHNNQQFLSNNSEYADDDQSESEPLDELNDSEVQII